MKQSVSNFLTSEIGKRNAMRFISALSEERILVSIPHVSSSGMSRVIRFREISSLPGMPVAILQFDWFIEQLGWSYSEKWDGINVGGCGMDMVFHILYNACGILAEAGFPVPENYSSLACNYHRI